MTSGTRQSAETPDEALRCECDLTDHEKWPDGRCHNEANAAELMGVLMSPDLCMPCLHGCSP